MNTNGFDKKKTTFMTDTGFVKQKTTTTLDLDRKTTLNYLVTKAASEIKEEKEDVANEKKVTNYLLRNINFH